MREYELTIIVQPKLEEQDRTQLLELVSSWLVPGATDETKPAIDVWGRRHLAYTINNFDEGYYYLYKAQVEPSRLTEIERNMQYNENIIRYMFVRKSE